MILPLRSNVHLLGPRYHRGGGEIALVARTGLSANQVSTGITASFEFDENIVGIENNRNRIVLIYRTPYSEVHPITVSTFLREFAEYLETIILITEPLLITGAININD